MAIFHKQGEAWKIHQRTSDPEGDYAKSLPGLIQKKLEALPPPRPVTHLKDMSPEKQEEMRRLYPAPAGMKAGRKLSLRHLTLGSESRGDVAEAARNARKNLGMPSMDRPKSLKEIQEQEP